MSESTGISWCDSTFNPWMGCTKVSKACDHCYAERDTKRFGRVEWGVGKPRVRTGEKNWNTPLRWNREKWVQCSCGWRGAGIEGGDGCGGCGKHGTTEPARRRVFCASLADWLDSEVPVEWLVDLLYTIRKTPNLDWLLLTKRIGNWHSRLMAAEKAAADGELAYWIFTWLTVNPPRNVWIGSTVIDQNEADRDIPKLLRVPAAVRFLSIEPMLGPINVSSDLRDLSKGLLHWVIAGGESGSQARPMSVQWVRELRDQAQAAGVAFHFKQWGEWAPARLRRSGDPGRFAFGDYEHDREIMVECDAYPRQFTAFGARSIMERVGKKASGRALDGREWSEFPT